MNSVINYYQNTFFSFGVNFAEINMETLPCFSERSKKIPNGKHAFEGGEKKNSSEFLNSCNEDNLIKIKAKLIKNLKVEVFGCITSLKHVGWVCYHCQNSWSYRQVIPVDPNGNVQLDCSFLPTPFGLSALSYSSALLLLKKKISFSLLWVFFLGMQLRDKAAEVYQFVTFIHGFHGSFFDLTILKWKKKACSHTSP